MNFVFKITAQKSMQFAKFTYMSVLAAVISAAHKSSKRIDDDKAILS